MASDLPRVHAFEVSFGWETRGNRLRNWRPREVKLHRLYGKIFDVSVANFDYEATCLFIVSPFPGRGKQVTDESKDANTESDSSTFVIPTREWQQPLPMNEMSVQGFCYFKDEALNVFRTDRDLLLLMDFWEDEWCTRSSLSFGLLGKARYIAVPEAVTKKKGVRCDFCRRNAGRTTAPHDTLEHGLSYRYRANRYLINIWPIMAGEMSKFYIISRTIRLKSGMSIPDNAVRYHTGHQNTVLVEVKPGHGGELPECWEKTEPDSLSEYFQCVRRVHNVSQAIREGKFHVFPNHLDVSKIRIPEVLVLVPVA